MFFRIEPVLILAKEGLLFTFAIPGVRWGGYGRVRSFFSGNEQKPILLLESVDRTATKQRLEGETRIEMETKRDGGGIVLTTMMMGSK